MEENLSQNYQVLPPSRSIQLFGKIAEEDPEKFNEITKTYNTALKLGAAEDNKNREKLAALTRHTTNQRNDTSFNDVRHSHDTMKVM